MRYKTFAAGLIALGITPFLTGCTTTGAIVAGSAIGGTVLLGQSPGQEIEQVYYLGVFDPQDQVIPPTVYRLTVHGQASGISNMKFGSGWVPAQLVDSLETHASFPDNGGHPEFDDGAKKDHLASLKSGRRMVMFGPEGFREAPKDHRLVIVMGASPEKFFQAIDSSLSSITQIQKEQAGSSVAKELALALQQLSSDQLALDGFAQDTSALTSKAPKN